MTKKTNTPDNKSLAVRAFDVNQADAYSISTPREEKVLLDADKHQITSVLDDTTIDHFVATHIHDDHVAGLRYLSDNGISIRQAYQPNPSRFEFGADGGVDPNVLAEYLENLSDQGIDSQDIEYLTTGDEILDDDDVSLTVLTPPATGESITFTCPSTDTPCEYGTEKANPNGIACRLDGPTISCLFMGDLENDDGHNAERWLITQHDDDESEVDLTANVLYIGHHGSNNATTDAFLDRVDPDHVVISSRLVNDHIINGNRYDGHPHDQTLKRLHEWDVDAYWTAVHGTISVERGVQIEHTTDLETTVPADLAALKYHARANNLSQDQLASIEEIAFTDLPEETPDWVTESAIVSEPEQTVADMIKQSGDTREQQDEQRTEKIDDLHTLEVEHRNLTRKKNRLEQEHKHLTEAKDDLEQKRDATPGLWDRFTDTVSQFGEPDDGERNETDPATNETHSARDPSDADSKPYHQADDIDDAIAILERDNASLEAAVDDLTQATDTLKADIATLEQQVNAPSGISEHINSAVSTDQADPRVIRQPRASGALSPDAGNGNGTTTNETNTRLEEETSNPSQMNKTQLVDKLRREREPTVETRSATADRDQDQSEDEKRS
jgi:competence protein ComEC